MTQHLSCTICGNLALVEPLTAEGAAWMAANGCTSLLGTADSENREHCAGLLLDAASAAFILQSAKVAGFGVTVADSIACVCR